MMAPVATSVTGGATPLLGVDGASFNSQSVAASVGQGLQGLGEFSKSLVEQAERLWPGNGGFFTSASSGNESHPANDRGSARGVLSAQGSSEGEGTQNTNDKKVEGTTEASTPSTPKTQDRADPIPVPNFQLSEEEKEERREGINSYFVDKYDATAEELISIGNELSFIVGAHANTKRASPNLSAIEQSLNNFYKEQKQQYHATREELRKTLAEAERTGRRVETMETKKELSQLRAPTLRSVAHAWRNHFTYRLNNALRNAEDRHTDDTEIQSLFLTPYVAFRERYPKIENFTEVLKEMRDFDLLQEVWDNHTKASHYHLTNWGLEFATKLVEPKWNYYDSNNFDLDEYVKGALV
jgi:hypothetical protein